MIYRELCPISGERSEIIFSRPYRLPEFKSLVERFPALQDFPDRDYEIRYCVSSDTYFQGWVLDDEEVGRYYYYDADAIKCDMEAMKPYQFAHMAEEVLVVRQLFPGRTPVVLDFGTNWGKWARMALAHGCDVYGVEVNRTAEKFCAGSGIKMVTLGNLGGCPKFDFINVDQVLEHLSAPYEVITHLRDALKPGGIIKISVPGSDELPRLLRAAQLSGDNSILKSDKLKALGPLGHVNLFTNRGLRLLGVKLGLQLFRPPFMTWLGAGQMWNLPRQFNRNLVVPFKRYFQRGTYLLFRKAC